MSHANETKHGENAQFSHVSLKKGIWFFKGGGSEPKSIYPIERCKQKNKNSENATFPDLAISLWLKTWKIRRTTPFSIGGRMRTLLIIMALVLTSASLLPGQAPPAEPGGDVVIG